MQHRPKQNQQYRINNYTKKSHKCVYFNGIYQIGALPWVRWQWGRYWALESESRTWRWSPDKAADTSMAWAAGSLWPQAANTGTPPESSSLWNTTKSLAWSFKCLLLEKYSNKSTVSRDYWSPSKPNLSLAKSSPATE